ncbi:MAG: RtcB family protein [Deltaproteobacteria bacterium]|nr:RtcB family protein [Deltaproteobacteria bacterium]
MPKQIHFFIEDPEEETRTQFDQAVKPDYVEKAALLPDAHLGYALPIGAVVAVRDQVLPSWVGYDIGCGISGFPTGIETDRLLPKREQIFQEIYNRIPVGFTHHKTDRRWEGADRFNRSDRSEEIFAKDGLKQLGTLGGGNHFIELGKDENNQIWILIHSGSRGLGHSVADYYIKKAAEGKKQNQGPFSLSTHLKIGREYLSDLFFCLGFALENRKQMMRVVLKILIGKLSLNRTLDFGLEGLIDQPHNFCEEKDGLMIHRKGVIPAESGKLAVMGGNMRDGCFIVEGLGNPQSLNSGAHGAGRVMGRRAAKKSLKLDEFKKNMRSVTAKVSRSTLDEAPDAYKDPFEVLQRQSKLVRPLHHILPLINVKG